MTAFQNQKGFAYILILPLVLAVIAVVMFFAITADKSKTPFSRDFKSDASSPSTPVDVGKRLSNGNCEGEGAPYKLGRSPMDPEDFSIIIPYGLLAGGHVTPVDHQYFSPKDYNSDLDAYEVYAMADAKIVEIEERSAIRDGKNYPSIRIVFSVTCTYFYYYDLVTSLSPDIKREYEEKRKGIIKQPLEINVKEGQLIGRIGGQTLDFAVWDTTRKLTGFAVPEHYSPEPWKIHTADPLLYYTDELRDFMLTRYVRTVEPVSGKIDFDIDGKLIGNWFLEGTENYAGGGEYTTADAYWKGHLAIVPDHIDPRGVFVSFGDFEGEATQLFVQDLHIRPENVDIETGIVRYQLGQFSYLKPDGQFWDRNSVAKDLKIVPSVQGNNHCVLLQLLEDRKLKMEYFSYQRCLEGLQFTDKAKYYLR